MDKFQELKEYAKINDDLMPYTIIKNFGYSTANIIYRNEVTVFVCKCGTVFITAGKKILDILEVVDWKLLNESVKNSFHAVRKKE